jgi:hypothetical protein
MGQSRLRAAGATLRQSRPPVEVPCVSVDEHGSEEAILVARVTHVQVSPGDVDESVRLFDESVIPAAEQEEGFMGAMLLVRPDGQALALDLCDTLENLRENERNGFYQTQVAKFADKITGSPSREFYEVRVAKGVMGGPEFLAAKD